MCWLQPTTAEMYTCIRQSNQGEQVLCMEVDTGQELQHYV